MITSSVDIAASELLAGRPVGIPTESVYGLAAPIDHALAIEQIFKLKKRPFFDPLIVHVNSIEMAKTLVQQWPKTADVLAQKFWPGPLSLVLTKNNRVSDLITSGLTTVALRSPDHPIATELIQKVGALAAPSANLFGTTSPTTAQHVENSLGTDITVLDGGPCKGGIESTVFDVDSMTVLRPGLVTREQLEAALGQKIETATSKKSPGHLEHHYMPKAPLVVIRGQVKDSEIRRAIGDERILKKICLSEDPTLAARELYARLREADADDVVLIISGLPETPTGLWAAIWDRLKRAATQVIPK